MKADVPSLDQFSLQAIEEAKLTGENQELVYHIEVVPRSITNRVVVALIDQNRRVGMGIAIYPATGEVCDVLNEGGVIGYLRSAPLNPNSLIACELTLYRFGNNCVCNAKIGGETFLYPAFSTVRGESSMTAFVGKEHHNGDYFFSWDHLSIETRALDGVIAA